MKPDFGIKMEVARKDKLVIEVDTGKAKYQGVKWRELGDFGKRKFENLLVMSRMSIDRTGIIKVIYI